MTRHRHYWRNAGTSMKTVYEACRCGDRRERPTTPAERRAFLKFFKDDGTHRLWHAFHKKFKKLTRGPKIKLGKAALKTLKKTAIYTYSESWRWVGYDLACRIEEWAKRRPAIKVVRCDDAVHAGSRLFLFPHGTAKTYMGTTVLYVPQCTGEQPIEFFLYPHSHHEPLQRALAELKREHGKKRGWGRRTW